MLILISILSFWTFRISSWVTQQDAYINPLMSSQDIENIRVNMGLDKPVYKRYLNWLKNTLSGNLGISYINHMPVTEQIMEKWEIHLFLWVLL